MVREHRTPAALPHSGGERFAVNNDKKINTSLKAGHVFETHADRHAHFISGKQWSGSGKVLFAEVLPSHEVHSTSRKGRKTSYAQCFAILALKKQV